MRDSTLELVAVGPGVIVEETEGEVAVVSEDDEVVAVLEDDRVVDVVVATGEKHSPVLDGTASGPVPISQRCSPQ